MSSTLTPNGWVVEPDVVDERKDLPRLSGAQITAINARIAAGSKEFPVGTRVVRTDDGLIMSVQGVGTSAVFASVDVTLAGAVKAVELAAPATLAMGGFSAADAQSILDNSFPLQDYAALRAYSGRAASIRIVGALVLNTPAGICGTFRRVSGDTTSADNGGTVIVDALSRRWKRVFDGEMSVLWFGADATGKIGDSTAAFNATAAAFAAQRTSPTGFPGWGLGTIKIPKGEYLINGEVALASQLGLRWLGDGEYATTLLRKVDTGDLFSVSTYVGVAFEAMTLIHVPVSPDRDTWTTNAFRLNGTGGGRNLQLKNVTTRNFNTIKKHSTAINEDTNVGEHCTFIDFNSFVDSENPQAVVNSYSNCTWSGAYKRIFWVAGHQNTLVTSGNMVGDGTTIELKNIASKFNDSGFTFINCKHEWTAANTVAGSRPKIIDSTGLFARMKLRFIDCSLFGGPTPHADARFARVTGGGVFDFTGGRIEGKLEMVGNTAIFAKNGDHIKFENVALDDPAGWVFTGGVSDSFMPVCIENCPSGSNNPINLTILRGRGVPAIAPRRTVVLGKPGSAESLFFVETVPIDLPSFGSRMLLNSVRIIVRSGTAHTANRIINVYSDAARTVLVATLTMASNPTTNSVHDIPLTGFPVSEEGFFFTVVNPVATLYAVLAVDFTTV